MIAWKPVSFAASCNSDNSDVLKAFVSDLLQAFKTLQVTITLH